MRLPALLLIGLAMAGCAGSSPRAETTTTQTVDTPGTTIPPGTTTGSPGPVRGALPDGTVYDIAFPSGRREEVVEVRAQVVIEIDGSEVPLPIDFIRTDRRGEDGEGLVVEAGEWTVVVGTPADDAGRRLIEESIETSTEVGMPVISIGPPLRWTGPRQVVYETFVVRSGCPEHAIACNPTHAVSVVPAGGASPESPLSVQSYALRPRSDPNYLPPGPLGARWYPDLVWTGAEMVVWGGSTNPGPPDLVDGAAYAPASDEWRRLSKALLSPGQETRAVWAGDEMVVLTLEVTAAWEPGGDRWRIVADGITPPRDPGMTVVHDSSVVAWTEDGLRRLEPGAVWEPMPEPGVGDPGPGGSVLRVAGDVLWAIGQDGCDRLLARWENRQWADPERVSLAGSPPGCGHPGQTAATGGALVLWDDTSGKVVHYEPDTGVAAPLPPYPLQETEHAPGPLGLDRGFLVTAALDGAIFDWEDMQWTRVELPGLGTDVDMVWTGEEVLMRGKCCYGPDDVDSWRWQPPGR